MAETEKDAVWTVPGAVMQDRDGQPSLRGGECRSCHRVVFPKPKVCPACWSEDIDDKPLARGGTLYSYTVVHVARKGWQTPYVISYVDLDDGVRVSAPLDRDPTMPPPFDSRVRFTVGDVGRGDGDARVMSHKFKLDQ